MRSHQIVRSTRYTCPMKKPSSTRYVAFLRGINVGGNKKVPMADLKKMLEKMGFTNVKTLLASGNVVFDAGSESPASLKKKLETQFEKTFGFTSSMIIRSVGQITELAEADPFKGIKVTPDIRLYVTFLPEDAKKSALKIPYVSPGKEFRILRASSTEVMSVLDVSVTGTIEVMGVLEKEFGKSITTRNWNTVQRLLL